MSNIYHLTNNLRIGPAPERRDSDLAGAGEGSRRFSGALDDARRDLERDLARRDAQRGWDDERKRKWDPDPGHVDVLDARSRLDRSGARQPGGVPSTTRDGPPRPIAISSADPSARPHDDTQPLVVPRPDTRRSVPPPPPSPRGDTEKIAIGADEEEGAPKRAIPPPPMPGSAVRRRRQTLSFATRGGAQPPPPPTGPLARRHRVSTGAGTDATATHTRGAPPARRGTGTKIMIHPPETSESEATRVWSREVVRDATGLPPLPDWAAGDGPEPIMERLIVDDGGPAANDTSLPAAPDPEAQFEAEFGAEFEAEFEQEPEANLEEVELPGPAARAARGEPAAEATSGIRRMLRGPLRAYATVSKLVQTFSGGTSGDTSAATLGVGEAPQTIGEPVSADLDLPPSAMEQLAAPTVLPASGRQVRASVGGRVIADRFIEAAALDAMDPETRLGRLGPKRAEVTVGAGDDKIGLAITTAGGHVSVEAHVPDDQMAELMKRRLDDLKQALERHDLELSDMTFGEASQGHEYSDGEPIRAANDSGEPQESESDPIVHGGFRTVA